MNCSRSVSGFLVIAGLLASARPAIAQTCVPPPSGLVAWWPGDGNTNDIAGGRDGQLVGSAMFAPGMVDGAFSFDGDGWIEVPDDPIWTLGHNDFTIDLWVRFNSLSGRDPFIGHDDGPGVGAREDNKWIFWYDVDGHDQLRGTPALRFHINRFPNGPVRDPVAVPWTPTLSRWYHVAVTKKHHSHYTLYIDGVPVATDVIGTPIADPVVPLTIGKSEEFTLDGLVDEVEIFNRALEPAEIGAIYAAGSAGKCKTP